MTEIYIAHTLRDEQGRTIEMRVPIIGSGDFPLLERAPIEYHTRVSSVAMVDTPQGTQPLPVEAWVRVEATSPAAAFAAMDAAIEAGARPALEAEAKRRIAEIMKNTQAQAREAAGRIVKPNGRR